MRDEFTNKILIFRYSLQAKVFNFDIVENNKAPTRIGALNKQQTNSYESLLSAEIPFLLSLVVHSEKKCDSFSLMFLVEHLPLLTLQ